MFIYNEDRKHWKFYEKEYNGFAKLYCFINYLIEQKQEKIIIKLVYGNQVVFALYDTMYETDNGMELNEEGYEEYNAIAFENIETHELLEVNYRNLPNEIYCGEERIL